jgi:hypothetical protein|tara:strand:+ start:1308 stop:2243 length:936 start_codon:yes stop_codon:yes gene_type:complete
MDSRPKYKSTLAFTDLLFNILIGFAFMFIIAFLLINPVEKEAQVEAKAEFMIVMEWDDQSAYDVDLWMSDPVGNIVGFPNMHAGLLHLDKDDLGQSNDTVVLADGTTKIIYLNREVMTIRGIVPGEYVVNNHLYSMKGQQKKGPMEVTTRIIKLNPFSEIHTGVVTLLVNGAEETVIRFTVNPEGNVTSKNHRKKRFAGRRQPNGIVSGSSNSSMHPPPTGGGEQILQGDEPADDDEVHGSAGFDDELHEQTGTSFAGGREPVVEGENGERSGTERSRYSYTITGAGQSTTTQSAEDRPHAEEEDPAMGGR